MLEYRSPLPIAVPLTQSRDMRTADALGDWLRGPAFLNMDAGPD
jgi:hypothetical protein